MKKKHIAMRCNQEQYEAIKPKLEKANVNMFMVFTFKKNYYLSLFKDGTVTNGTIRDRGYYGEIHEQWNEKIFLEACGIETIPTLEEVKEQEEELWLPVHNYYGFYEVSNMGNVRSVSRKVKHSRNPEFTKDVFGRVLEKTLNSDGRYKVRLSMFGLKRTHLVSHLVSEVFLGHLYRNEFVCVDHVNEDKTDDRAINLQIISKQENTKKSFDYKLDMFKNGDFWFHSTGELCLIFEVTKSRGGTVKCKHISNNSEHFTYHGICTMDRLATTEEVTEALKKEAVRRGFVEGVSFLECKRQNGSQGSLSMCSGNYYFNRYEDGEQVLLSSGRALFCNGIWATVIQTKTIQEAEELLKELGHEIKIVS